MDHLAVVLARRPDTVRHDVEVEIRIGGGGRFRSRRAVARGVLSREAHGALRSPLHHLHSLDLRPHEHPVRDVPRQRPREPLKVLRPVLTSARHVVDCVRDGDGVQREEDVMNLRGGAGRATSTSAGVQGVQRISSEMWAPRRAARETNEKRSARARASVGSGRSTEFACRRRNESESILRA